MKYSLEIILLFIFISCKTKTEINTNVVSKKLPNNKIIKILKTEETATHIGVFTHSNYGSTYHFNYQFTIDKNDIIWKNKGTAVPKKIIFCQDSVYVKYLQKKIISYQQIYNDTLKQIKHKDTIVEKYDQFIDNRYFFKWFGDVNWISISKNKYNSKKISCNEYSIPNDNDFKMIK